MKNHISLCEVNFLISRFFFKENELKARSNQVEVLRIKNTTLNHEMSVVSQQAQQQAETGIFNQCKDDNA